MMKPKIVCLCGSTRFIREMACLAWALERDEGFITLGLHLLPDNYPGVQPDHMAEAEGRKEHFDELHKRKIDLADEVLVVNIGGYIGESTRSEIDYAMAHGKPVHYIEKENQMLPNIEVVSAKVHEAWMGSKRAQGVTTRKAEDGEELMVPYGELSEKAKELDRGTVRAVYAAIHSLANRD